MKRRDFLRTVAAVGAATAAVGAGAPIAAARRRPPGLPGPSLLDLPASQAPVDHVVVMMMENRSFDHYLGWLGGDLAYLEEGRRLYGRRFRVEADTSRTYVAPDGARVATYPLASRDGMANPYRGCGHRDPGHGWSAGRVQRDRGFLAAGSGNDEYALGYFEAEDLPFYAGISRRFTVLDRSHCSVLGPTFPNREYLHSAQSGGLKDNSFPPEVGYPTGFTWPTIWDRLGAAGVSARYYFVDLPVTALWGPRLVPITSPIARYFEDAAAGTLPHVVFLDPGFTSELRTDEHPHGDVRDGEKLVQACIRAFVESPHWERGLFILTYDEWGGFFDHVRPPRLADDRASSRSEDDFRQAGFRVPTRLLSPYARRGFVDHLLYDHASILRFLEWRFLGAPAWGPGRAGDGWFLTRRDRHANSIGYSLRPSDPDPEVEIATPGLPPSSPPCATGEPQPLAVTGATAPAHPFERGLREGFFERMGYRIDLAALVLG